MLDSITIRGFKSIAAIEDLKLGPVNILIGANGSGKSNFLEVFTLLFDYSYLKLGDYVARAGGARQLLHFGSEVTTQIRVGLVLSDGRERELEFTLTAVDGLFVSRNESFIGGGPVPVTDIGFGIPDQGLDELSGSIFRQWRAYHFNNSSATSPMRGTAKLHDNRYLRSDASNLSAFLYFLREKHAESYTLIRRTVQQVAPFFEDFLLEPLNLSAKDIKLEWRHKGSDQYFDASSLSDGTLRFIALATLFLQPEELRPSLILIDELELGLHPFAIGILASLIRHASGRTQVIVSTQSPQLIDYFEPKDILVADLVNGSTEIKHLDSARLASWLEDYSLGQLWEKNELGGRPGRE